MRKRMKEKSESNENADGNSTALQSSSRRSNVPNKPSNSSPTSFRNHSNPADFFGDALPEINQQNKIYKNPFGSLINLYEYNMLPNELNGI